MVAQASGLSYHHHPNGWFTSVHILVVDPKEHAIVPVKSLKSPRATVLALCRDYGALAAVNGGFWRSDGQPAGLLKIDHQWYGWATKPRGAIGWSRDAQTVYMDRLWMHPHAPTELFPVSDFPEGSAQAWRGMVHIMGGTPLLISRGQPVADYTPEETRSSFLMRRLARTAVGIRANGEWVFVVADGHRFGWYGGMSMPELSALMLSLGCVKALNLDGGGSSTLVLAGAVLNRPCGSLREGDQYVEAVSNAILIFPVMSP